MSAPSLLRFLAHQIIRPVIKKGLFAGEYVWFAEYLSHAQLLYEISATLGYTYRDKLNSFTVLFSEPGRQTDVASFLESGAIVATRLSTLAGEPKNVYDLFFESEGKKLMIALHSAGAIQNSGWEGFPKLWKLKMPLKNYFEHLDMIALEGIQLGSQYSELTDRLFSYQHNAEEWRFAYEAGLNIDASPPETVPLRERESEAKELIRPYVERTHPGLLTTLEL